jgi:hypothetical protein
VNVPPRSIQNSQEFAITVKPHNYVGCELVDPLFDVVALPGLDPGIDWAIQYSAGQILASDNWLLMPRLKRGMKQEVASVSFPLPSNKTAPG